MLSAMQKHSPLHFPLTNSSIKVHFFNRLWLSDSLLSLLWPTLVPSSFLVRLTEEYRRFSTLMSLSTVFSSQSHLSTLTQVLYLRTILRFLLATWAFCSHATVYIYSATFQRDMYFILYYIYLTALVTTSLQIKLLVFQVRCNLYHCCIQCYTQTQIAGYTEPRAHPLMTKFTSLWP